MTASRLHVDRRHLPLSSSVTDPTVYPIVESTLGIAIAKYALGSAEPHAT